MSRAPFSLADTWDHVADLYAMIVSLFGLPAAIAARQILPRAKRRDILSWLGPVEALARRLLLLKALTLSKPNCPPAHRAKGKLANAFTDSPAWAPAENSEDWRVVFRVAPRLTQPDRRLPAGLSSNPSLPAGSRLSGGINFNAFALARRIEALRRVLENPEPALQRLARLLSTRRSEIAAAFAPYRPPAPCAAEALAETQAELDLAFNSS